MHPIGLHGCGSKHNLPLFIDHHQTWVFQANLQPHYSYIGTYLASNRAVNLCEEGVKCSLLVFPNMAQGATHNNTVAQLPRYLSCLLILCLLTIPLFQVSVCGYHLTHELTMVVKKHPTHEMWGRSYFHIQQQGTTNIQIMLYGWVLFDSEAVCMQAKSVWFQLWHMTPFWVGG